MVGAARSPKYALIQADAARLPLADGAVDMVFTSPPYCDARLYGRADVARSCEQWVAWMLDVVTELTRVCNGLVLVNCAGVTRDRRYWPACEGLMWEWWKRGGNLWRPAYWHRVGIPGSGGKQWLRADIEYVIPFKRDREWLPWSDNTANGHVPKWGPGGEMSHRLSEGRRVNQWGPVGSAKGGGNRFKRGKPIEAAASRPSHHPFGNRPSTLGRRPNGERKPPYLGRGMRDGVEGSTKGSILSHPVKANPGTLVKVIVGGGAMGHPLAHENEAPFPQRLAEWFIRSWCRPGGWVLDPFVGSGTTVAAALALGRNAIGIDIRASQIDLSRRRLSTPAARRRPKPRPKGEMVLFPLEVA